MSGCPGVAPSIVPSKDITPNYYCRSEQTDKRYDNGVCRTLWHPYSRLRCLWTADYKKCTALIFSDDLIFNLYQIYLARFIHGIHEDFSWLQCTFNLTSVTCSSLVYFCIVSHYPLFWRSETLHQGNSPLFEILESCEPLQLSNILNRGEFPWCNVPSLQNEKGNWPDQIALKAKSTQNICVKEIFMILPLSWLFSNGGQMVDKQYMAHYKKLARGIDVGRFLI